MFGRQGTTIGLGALLLLLLGGSASAQGLKRGGDVQLSARLTAFRQDGYTGAHWAPGIDLAARFPVHRAIFGQVLFSNARTRRTEELDCPGLGSCGPFGKVTGWMATVMASVGAAAHFNRYTLLSSAGYGLVLDSQPGGQLEYGGPSWVGDLTLQRRLTPRVGLECGYRVLYESWDSGYEHVLQGVHLTHHEVSIGVVWAPWTD